MKYCLLFVLIGFLNTKIAFAETKILNPDTSINRANYQQSRNYFLETYGKDDSTKAFINFYFDKRGNRLVDAVPPVISGSLLWVALHKNQPVNPTKDDYSFIITGPLLLLTTGFAAGFVVQEIKRAVLTKKKLYNILNNYTHNIPLPVRFTHQRKYKTELDRLQGKHGRFRLF